MNETTPPKNRIEKQYSIFMDIKILIDKVFPERNKAIYFSSTCTKELIDEVRKNNPSLQTPWDTEAGKAILKISSEQGDENGIEWNRLSGLRRQLIYTFAQRASGNFTIVFPERSDEPIEGALSTLIMPVLQRNQNVTTINNQNKLTVIRHYFEKIDSRPEQKGKILHFKL